MSVGVHLTMGAKCLNRRDAEDAEKNGHPLHLIFSLRSLRLSGDLLPQK
jgi:hypothetical protein